VDKAYIAPQDGMDLAYLLRSVGFELK
jgi:hypothetical protein